VLAAVIVVSTLFHLLQYQIQLSNRGMTDSLDLKQSINHGEDNLIGYSALVVVPDRDDVIKPPRGGVNTFSTEANYVLKMPQNAWCGTVSPEVITGRSEQLTADPILGVSAIDTKAETNIENIFVSLIST